MGKSYRVAIIGLGVIGQRMLNNMPEQGSLEIAGGWDQSTEACAEAKARFPWLGIADDPASLIGSDDVDIVYIGTPPRAHADYVRMALAAGKAVFCEKPLGVDLPESRALTAEVQASGRPAAVNLSLAGARGVARMRDALADGSLGDVQGADIRLHFAQWPRGWQANATWLAERDQGGFTREVATHFIYLADALFGSAELRSASIRYPEGTGAETHTLALLDCGGVPVSLAASVGGAGPDLIEFTLWGTRKSLRLTDFYRLWATTEAGWVDAMPTLDAPATDAYMRQLDALVRMMDGDANALPDFSAALRAQEIVEAILNAQKGSK